VRLSARNCRAYAATKKTAGAAADLKVLKSALRHWQAEYGPLAALPEVWLPTRAEPPDRWLTRTEAAQLLRAARRVPYLARMILLGFYTGPRPGVIKALRWDWIDFEHGIMRRRAAGEQNIGTKRRPPARLGRRILAHLRRWRRLDGPGRAAGGALQRPEDRRSARIVKARRQSGQARRQGHAAHVATYPDTWLMLAEIDPW
jgi:integrase